MGFLGKASEFFAEPGAAVGSFVGDVLHNASNYVCQLHYNTPGVIFDLSPFNRELWKEFCKERPSGLPPAPQPKFVGGQCDSVSYNMIVRWRNKDGSTDYDRQNGFWGPITDVEFVRNSSGNSDHRGFLQDLYVTSRGADASPGELNRRLVASPYVYAEQMTGVDMARADGASDNCGNPPSPVVRPVVLPIEQRTTNINVLSVDKSTVNVVTAVFDFPSASVDFNLSVPLRVTIDQRKFYLNIDGWYSGDPSDGSPPDLSPVQDSVLQLNGTLNQYFAPINPSVNPSLTLIAPSFGKDSDEQKDISGAQWLIIDLTKMPDKTQYGGGSPTVYFAGWIEFLKEGRAFPRQQINFERSIFRFPDGADGYAYTFTNGAQGNVSVYVEETR